MHRETQEPSIDQSLWLPKAMVLFIPAFSGQSAPVLPDAEIQQRPFVRDCQSEAAGSTSLKDVVVQ
jgi:hypothetical protein